MSDGYRAVSAGERARWAERAAATEEYLRHCEAQAETSWLVAVQWAHPPPSPQGMAHAAAEARRLEALAAEARIELASFRRAAGLDVEAG